MHVADLITPFNTRYLVHHAPTEVLVLCVDSGVHDGDRNAFSFVFREGVSVSTHNRSGCVAALLFGVKRCRYIEGQFGIRKGVDLLVFNEMLESCNLDFG